MDAHTFLNVNGAKAGDMVEALGQKAEALAEAIEKNSAVAVEMLRKASEELAGVIGAKAGVVGEKAAPIAEAIGAKAGMIGEKATPIADLIEAKASPIADLIEAKADVWGESLEKKYEQARKDMMESMKDFKFGSREAFILGGALGLLAAVLIIRRMDRQAAAERLRAAGARVSETAQGLTSRVGDLAAPAGERVGQAVQGLSGRVGELAAPATERVGQAVQTVKERATEVVQQVREQAVEGARERLSGATERVQEAATHLLDRQEEFGAGLNKETRAAVNEVVVEADKIQDDTEPQTGKLTVSDGMKVVAFDGTDIGRVQEVREDVFVLNRPKGSDLLVPLDEVARIEGTVVYLRVEANRVVKMGWGNA